MRLEKESSRMPWKKWGVWFRVSKTRYGKSPQQNRLSPAQNSRGFESKNWWTGANTHTWLYGWKCMHKNFLRFSFEHPTQWGFVPFFLSWVAKTQFNHWTKFEVCTQLMSTQQTVPDQCWPSLWPTCYGRPRVVNKSSQFLWVVMHSRANRFQQSKSSVPNYQGTLRPVTTEYNGALPVG